MIYLFYEFYIYFVKKLLFVSQKTYDLQLDNFIDWEI